ncbi:hypothetical protein LEP1GSC188_1567 [Leptospira weilii serovar Topaz str. LT2116]|uniref:Uncharacterized protein n=1 Tax=Leptospira weilii serovar Topaz str. LT2116 TaxID=1088540 RepID=M3G1H5_9LEPT|nr:hypothetical protein LEP1GSC188_1567 [Leptospira weilii serovar Topaz str. LT2116]
MHLSLRPFNPIQFRTGKKILDYTESTFPFPNLFKKKIFQLCLES